MLDEGRRKMQSITKMWSPFLAFRLFPGCDYTSAVIRNGKVKPYTTMLNSLIVAWAWRHQHLCTTKTSVIGEFIWVLESARWMKWVFWCWAKCLYCKTKRNLKKTSSGPINLLPFERVLEKHLGGINITVKCKHGSQQGDIFNLSFRILGCLISVHSMLNWSDLHLWD